ncbi:phenylacetate--CoA ligase family protein [bacterium]|nr:phenylacetate--CoA ligase family protein [bacterium]
MNSKERLKSLNEAYKFAKEKSIFYRKHLPDIKISCRDDLYSLPYLEKTHINDHSLPDGTDLFTGPIENCIVVASSGSTGKRKYTLIEREVWNKAIEFQEEALKYGGLEYGDKIAILSAAAPFDPTLSALIELTFRIGCTVLPVTGNADIDTLIDYLLLFKPDAAYAVPSFALRIAQRVVERNENIHLDKLVYVGEHLGNQAEKRLKEVFKCSKIFAAGYTTADTGLLGIPSKEETNIYHAVEDFHFIEIIDPDTGKEACKGVTGEIVVSNYFRKLFPLIRFRTKDLAYWLDDEQTPDSIGRRFVLLGRGEDEIMIRAMEVPTDIFVETVQSIPEFSGPLQIIIDIIQGVTEINVKAECNMSEKAIEASHLIRKKILDLNPELKHEVEDEKIIALTVTPVKNNSLPNTLSGKVKLVIDRRID